MSTLLPFIHYKSDPLNFQGLPVLPSILRLIWESSFTEIGQFTFFPDDIDLLAIYTREKPAFTFRDSCLFKDGGLFVSKGVHYFKEYPKRYGTGDFKEFIKTLSSLILKVASSKFEEEDEQLKLKVLLTLNDELLNHLAWGVYLAYKAAGVNQECSAPIMPSEISAMEKALLLGAKILVEWVTMASPRYEENLSQIDSLITCEPLKFIGNIAKRRNELSPDMFFRPRVGCKELENVIHGLKIAQKVTSESISIDCVVAPFYGGLTSAAIAHAILGSLFKNLSFKIIVHSPHEHHFHKGELVRIDSRGLAERLSKMPPLIRYNKDKTGLSLLVIDDSITTGATFIGIRDLLLLSSPSQIYLSPVSASASLSFDGDIVKTAYGELNIKFGPTFEQTGVVYLRHFQKTVKRKDEV